VQVNAESTAGRFHPIAVTLRGGRRVTLRSIRPDDGALQAAFRAFPWSRATRGSCRGDELSPSMLKHAVHPVAAGTWRWSLAEPALLTRREYSRRRPLRRRCARQTCEFAITVSEDWRGTTRVTSDAGMIRSRARRPDGMEGFILAGNTPMRNLAKRLGFAVTASSEGPAWCGYGWICKRSGSALPGHEGAG